MPTHETFADYAATPEERMQAVFASIFILQNRLQTACEKVQTGMSMKQWLLLAMAESCPPPRTLTRVGARMGCSRQNVKKLAMSLQSRGFLRMTRGAGNAVYLEPTDAAHEYFRGMTGRQTTVLDLLFSDFSPDQTALLFEAVAKLYDGVERVERYADELRGASRHVSGTSFNVADNADGTDTAGTDVDIDGDGADTGGKAASDNRPL